MAPISNKILNTCIFNHKILKDRVRGLPMSHPSLQELAHHDIVSLGVDFRPKGSHWYESPGNTHLLFFVITGHLICTQENLTIHPGEILIVPAGMEKSLQSPKSSLNGAWIHLGKGGAWGPKITSKIHSLSSRHNLQIFSLIEGMSQEIIGAQNDSKKLLQQQTRLLLQILLQIFPSQENPLTLNDQKLMVQLQELWAEVSSSLQQSWTVKDLAKRLHLSESHFHRKVTSLLGKTPMEIITEMRMERTSTLLKTSSAKLDLIAAEVGYQTPYAFSNAFKAYTGIRPGSYRKKWVKSTLSR
jgi:AraC-like DNA-binding protein